MNLLMFYKDIEALEEWTRKEARRKSEQEKRTAIRIAIIDDQPFSGQQNLRNAGYNVTEIGDIKNVAEIIQYPIVLCDLQDVGAHFQSKYQGGFLIDEIKKNFPDKFVIAYTGGSPDQSVVNYARRNADAFIRKDVDINEWRDTLDEIIDTLSDPLEVWRRQRDALVDVDVSTKEILRLEDAFVRSVLNRSKYNYADFVSRVTTNKDVRSIGQSLVASGIFEFIVG